MAAITFPGTKPVPGDPEYIPLRTLPRPEDLEKALEALILSPSGWRTVFGPDGESREGTISPAHEVIAATAAGVFAAYLKKKSGLDHPAVILGMDTRPTGPAIAGLMSRVFIHSGCSLIYIAIAAAPEIMAYARSKGVQGFAYISASHNPAGHNGLKFGLCDGGVLEGPESVLLSEMFRSRITERDAIDKARLAVQNADTRLLVTCYAEAPLYKKEALAAYGTFAGEIAAGPDVPSGTGSGPGADGIPGVLSGDLFSLIRMSLAENPLGVLADFNGSARTVSIDRDFFSGLGLRFACINENPGSIAHRIVPEGESLIPCALALEEKHAGDTSFVMGYVPDCDGDRGNIVFWDEGLKKARTLEAQEVFALTCVSELAFLVWSGVLKYDNKGNALARAAIAVNGPTSLRIDRIAGAFDIPVFRCETGEANVVGLARKLREKGYLVRICGEGSAGGSIIHPQAVRDPLSSVMALVKILTLKSVKDRQGLYEIWCDLSGQTEMYREDFTLSDIIASLPAFTTTGIYTPEAQLAVQKGDHAKLKKRYQNIFLSEWEGKKERLRERWGITGWEAAAFTGSAEKRGLISFEEAGRGGLKIHFMHESGRVTASIWMRGSATEPVFRVMADAEGSDTRLEKELIEWQRHLVTLAASSGQE
ncbi:MAG: phosphatidylglycerol lysyltransferase [Spirochaetaceae bacterium]|jgi:phosphoglucomutase|nr:phosphatidylglycerol lysyltransferase [Spirochaetaceae bacterium]